MPLRHRFDQVQGHEQCHRENAPTNKNTRLTFDYLRMTSNSHAARYLEMKNREQIYRAPFLGPGISGSSGAFGLGLGVELLCRGNGCVGDAGSPS